MLSRLCGPEGQGFDQRTKALETLKKMGAAASGHRHLRVLVCGGPASAVRKAALATLEAVHPEMHEAV
jgi:hypothetical protein